MEYQTQLKKDKKKKARY
jgi:hypothetical protein